MAQPLADTLGLILAGGAARRLGGGDKGLLDLGGRPILAHVVDALRPQVAALALNANGDPARFAAFGLPVVPDLVAGRGPLEGVRAGLLAARTVLLGARRVLSVPADAPFLPADLAARLAAADAPVAVARSSGRAHHVIALWSLNLAPALAGALDAGVRRVEDFAAASGAVSVDWPDVPDPFLNVNTPADLGAARVRLEADSNAVAEGNRGSNGSPLGGGRP
jgi:molybdopterin-guanine dinucleotide biosynthesis protein A